jgi:manganese transport protein
VRKTLVWFVISAAFIGPGTVTTATSAGAHFGTQLLWTILFAVFACIVLQEGAARINIASGLSLGQAITSIYKSGRKNSLVALATVFTIFLGCAAYEAGNILGAVSGITLTVGLDRAWLTIGIILIAGILLYTNSFKLLTNFLAAIIGIMGLGLIILLFSIDLELSSVLQGFVLPTIPVGAELLTIGLIGTTVVPYNLFLGSKVGESQEIRTMRRGLVISVLVGGLISISLILIGSQVKGEFSFANIAATLAEIAGSWSHYVFAFGLFAAGLTSAITAPWAASIAVSTTIKFNNEQKAFRLTWIIVLAAGLVFGVSDVKPIPIIILAQALNGIILPFLSITIFFVLNNKRLMKDYTNRLMGNMFLLIVVWITLILGLLNLLKATYAGFRIESAIDNTSLLILSITSLLITIYVGYRAYRD